jgi:TonB family protein
MIVLRGRGRRWLAGWALVAWAALGGCGTKPRSSERPHAVPVDVFSDTGRAGPLRVVRPAEPAAQAEVWLTHVSPARERSLEPPDVESTAETLAALPPPPPPGLAVDEGLKPPIPRARAALAVPAGARGFVELDVRVDERGRVAAALPAGGSGDSALVRAATDCALGMSFYPALRAGRPVAVWCRQRFDFGVREPAR